MNNLEKINALLAKEGRTIVYGEPESATAETVVSLSLGDGDEALSALGDSARATYTTVDITVYAVDFLTGYDLLLAIRNEIAAAVKSTVSIVFKRFLASKYDAALARHILNSQYKIIE